MFSQKLFMIIFAVLFIFLISCSEEEPTPAGPPQVLSNNYSGFMQLHFTNTFPAFDESTQVDITIDKYGKVTFGTGTLTYNADDDNGQSRIRRVGTLSLNPSGNYFDNSGKDYLGVEENTALFEIMTVWYWDDNTHSWIEMINDTLTGTWNGGLAFSIDDAALAGSVTQSSTVWGSTTWGLYLVVTP